MRYSRMLVAAASVCLAPGVARAAAAKAQACPDLSGKFTCPAVERYHQKAMSIVVDNDLAAKTFHFAYDDGSPAVTIVANGRRTRKGAKDKTWSSYFCRDRTLIQEVFNEPKAAKPSGGSKQGLNADRDYEVRGPDDKVTLVCRRSKPAP